MGLVDRISGWRADRKIRKLLRGAPERPLAEVEENAFVRITGTVQPHRGRVLEAPLSGRLCAYYSVVVHTRMRVVGSLVTGRVGRHDQRGFASVFDEQQQIPFELEAGGARAVIDPASAWISSGFDYKTDLGNERAHAAFVRLGLVGSADEPRFLEAILEIGERIALYGAGVREPDTDDTGGERGYRDGGRFRLRFTGTDKFPLVIRDDLESL